MRKTLLFTLLCFLAFSGLQAQFSIKKVLLEELTGAWCGWCVDGAVVVDDILDTYPNCIGVSVHQGDAMQFTEGLAVANFYNDGYPTATIDRKGLGLSRNVWKSTVGTNLQGAGSVTVSIENLTYNGLTREVNFDVKGFFTGPVTGDIRINAIIAENNVTGAGSGYNQANYDNGTPGHPYQGAGNPIIGFVHNQVTRAYLGGAWGTAGIVPGTVNFGAEYTQNYSYTLPAGVDETEVFVVGFFSLYGPLVTDRDVLNAEEAPLPLVVGLDNLNSNISEIKTYPNPATGWSKLTYTVQDAAQVKVELLNTLGQNVSTVFEGFLNSGVHTSNLDLRNLSAGVYLVKLSAGDQTVTRRIMVSE